MIDGYAAPQPFEAMLKPNYTTMEFLFMGVAIEGLLPKAIGRYGFELI
jgi:hypothetical protein